MPGLDPGIHVFLAERSFVDGRDKSGHDVRICSRERHPPRGL